MSFHWFEFYIFLPIIALLGVLVWRKVLNVKYFYPIAIGFWVIATVANVVTGETLTSFIIDLATILGLCYLYLRERTN